jgi:MFS family permease
MTDPVTARSEWRQGWRVVLAAASGMSLSPLVIYSMGLFVLPLEREFGWSRTMITSGMTLIAVVSVIFAGPFGALIERFGPRRIAIPGVLLYCLSFGALATISGAAVHWWIVWTCIAASSLLVKATVWSAAVVSRFDKARGLALAVVLSGSGFTGIVAPIVAGYLIEHHGWRWAYAGLALLWCAVSMTLILLYFRSAADNRGSGAAARPDRSKTPGLGIGEALRSATFLKLALACFMIILIVTGGLVHFVPVITERGLDRSVAVPLASIIGLAAFFGRMLTGSLLDRFDARFIGAAAFAMPGLACCVLIAAGDGMPLAVAALVALMFGLSSGAEFEVASYLSSRVFGLRNFGALFGIMVGIIGLASGVGPSLASLSFDRTGSYDLALWIGAPLAFVAALLIATIGSYRRESGGSAH